LGIIERNTGLAKIWSALVALNTNKEDGLLNKTCNVQFPAVNMSALTATIAEELITEHDGPAIPHTLMEQNWSSTMKLLPKIVMLLPEYTKLGYIPSSNNMIGEGKTSTALSKYANMEEGLLVEMFMEQLPEGVWGLDTTITLVFDTIEQFNAATEHTNAVQFWMRGKNPDPAIVKVELAYTLPGLDGWNARIVGSGDQDIVATVLAKTLVYGNVTVKINWQGFAASLNKLLVATTAADDETTLQLIADWLQVDAVQIPTTKLVPKTVTVEPKYGGLGHTGKLVSIRGSTTWSKVLVDKIMSLGFTKLMRTLQLPDGVAVESVTNTVENDATLQDKATTEQADAMQDALNLKKLSPYTVIELPGKVLAGKISPKFWWVVAFATIEVPLMIWTNKFFVDSLNKM
jgi:hypothetical protein